MTDHRSGFQITRDLVEEAKRLRQHAKHLSVRTEIPDLEDILQQLQLVHTDEKGCYDLCVHHGDRYPPWGTRYASWGERAVRADVWKQMWRSVFPRRR